MSKAEEGKFPKQELNVKKRVVMEGGTVYIIIKSDEGADVKVELKNQKLSEREFQVMK
jgi:hypothetical protein